MSKTRINDYRNVVAGHVLFAPPMPADKVWHSRGYWDQSMARRDFARHVFVPGQRSKRGFAVGAARMPAYLRGHDFGWPSFYGNDNEPFVSCLHTRSRDPELPTPDFSDLYVTNDFEYIAWVTSEKNRFWPVYGFGVSVLDAVMDALEAGSRKLTGLADTSRQAMEQQFEQAGRELTLQTKEAKRQFVCTSSVGGNVFSDLVRSPQGKIIVEIHDDESFDSTDSDEPYTYQGTHWHSQSVVDVRQPTEQEAGEPYIDRELRYVLDYSATANPQFFVGYLDNGPLDDYYEGHKNWLNVVAAFDSEADADEFVQFSLEYGTRRNLQIFGLNQVIS